MRAVELSGICFKYQGGEREALSGVDFHAEEGERVAIVGLTAAGKSSLLRCVNRLIPTSYRGDFSGRALLFGQELSGLRPAQLCDRVGMVFQDFESQLFSTSAELDVAFGPENLGLPRAELQRRVTESLEATGLLALRKRDPATLSGGQKQRLAIACALALSPRLLCLDEPTTDLDPEGREEVALLLQTLCEQGRTVILAEHEPELILHAHRLVGLEQGQKSWDQNASALLWNETALSQLGVRPPDLCRIFNQLHLPQRPLEISAATRLLREKGFGVRPGAAEELLQRDARAREKEGAELIRVETLSHRYPNGVLALSEVNLRIREGEFIALLGKNGSGKTTLVKHLNGLLRPTSGAVLLSGKDTRESRLSDLGRRVGFVFQDPDHQIFAPTVFEEVAFASRNFGFSEAEVKRRVARSLERVGLAGYEDKDPFLLTKGERQRVALASVLAAEPEIIILDEPTTGLDYPAQLAVMELLRELNQAGRTIIIITHTIWIAATFARRCLLMSQGQIIADLPTRQALSAPELLRKAGLRQPQVTALGLEMGVPSLTAEEFLSCVQPPAGGGLT